MLLGVSKAKNFDMYKQRRKELLSNIKQKFNVTDGLLLLFYGFEHEKMFLGQDSSFYYLSGITSQLQH